jgi:hypothetical protein
MTPPIMTATAPLIDRPERGGRRIHALMVLIGRADIALRAAMAPGRLGLDWRGHESRQNKGVQKPDSHGEYTPCGCEATTRRHEENANLAGTIPVYCSVTEISRAICATVAIGVRT